jgi:hypothetical protein
MWCCERRFHSSLGGTNRLEEAAKFLATIAGLSLTVFITGVQAGRASSPQDLPARIAVVLWLVSLVVAILVVFPWHYRYHSQSVQSIKAMHRRVVRFKDLLLYLSALLYLAGLVLLMLRIVG